jgi:hypothetical protein
LERASLDGVYDGADYVGRLVVDGPSDRPTEYDGSQVEPRGRWDPFPLDRLSRVCYVLIIRFVMSLCYHPGEWCDRLS